MRRVTIIMAALAAMTSSAGAQTAAPADAFTEALETFRADANIPSLSVIVLQDGEPAVEYYGGWSDDEFDYATGPETSYYIASVTKPIAGTAFYRAELAGELDLDERLDESPSWQRFNGWFPNSPIPFAGGRIGEVEIGGFDGAEASWRDMLHMRVNGELGTGFIYNPVAYAQLSRVFEDQSDESFRAFLHRQIFDPAGMGDTAAGWRDVEHGHVLSQLAPPMVVRDGQFHKQPLPDDDLRAAAGLYMSARELARFDRALDRDVFMTEADRREMWTPPANPDGSVSVYAHGWYVQDYDGERLIWHGGWQPEAYSAIYLKMPDRGLTLIALANSEGLYWGNPVDDAMIETAPLVRLFLENFLEDQD